MDKITELFGEVIYSYTRKQAIADGHQVEVSDMAKQAGLKCRTFITHGVFEECVCAREDENENARLWDILFLLRVQIARTTNTDTIRYTVKICNRNRELFAQVGAFDIDDCTATITIMLPHEI